LFATLGEIDGRAQIAKFLGLARLVTSQGYQMETNGLIAELRTGLITSDGLLEVRAPFGQLTAGKVTFQTASKGLSQHMLFTEGVHLLYQPQTP
jgi:lipopolysaccharide export system protein LptC